MTKNHDRSGDQNIDKVVDLYFFLCCFFAVNQIFCSTGLFVIVAAQCIDNLRFLPYWDVITNYSPPINFGAILLVTLCHVVKTVTGQLSCNNPHLSRYLSSDCFHGKETKVGTRVSSFPFSH